jgi:predicted alpha/beta hydrolase
MQSAGDIFLGLARGPKGRDAYIRQMRDGKASADLPTINAKGLLRYATLCGACLARAHAKAGGAAAIAGYLGKGESFVDALAKYAVAYADQVETDFETFQRAVRAGRFPVDTLPDEMEQAIR